MQAVACVAGTQRLGCAAQVPCCEPNPATNQRTSRKESGRSAVAADTQVGWPAPISSGTQLQGSSGSEQRSKAVSLLLQCR